MIGFYQIGEMIIPYSPGMRFDLVSLNKMNLVIRDGI